MAETLRGGLSLSLCGFGFWSHDISGFESTASPDLYKRWVAFGLLSSHSRLHGSSSYRVPWLFDEEAVDVLRFFTQWKGKLMPYLYSASVEAHRRGIPVMRPMVLAFPDDPVCRTLDRQYMLGQSILVAPVFNREGTTQTYLPECGGLWTHLFTGKQLEGGRYYNEKHDYFSLPVYVRANSLIAMKSGGLADVTGAEYAYHENPAVYAYEISEAGAEMVIVDNKGERRSRVHAVKKEKTVEINADAHHDGFSIIMCGKETNIPAGCKPIQI
jgi:alpha-D-xyloside xylohydrolase